MAVDFQARLAEGGKRQTASGHLVFVLEFVTIRADSVGFVLGHILKSFLPTGTLNAGSKTDKGRIERFRIIRLGTGTRGENK